MENVGGSGVINAKQYMYIVSDTARGGCRSVGDGDRAMLMDCLIFAPSND